MPRQASRTTKWKLISTYGPEEYGSVLVRSTPKLAICTASILFPVDSTGEHETRIASDFEPSQAHRSLSSYCARQQTAHNASDDKSGQSDTVSDKSSRPFESGTSCQTPSRTPSSEYLDKCEWTRRGRETLAKNQFENSQRDCKDLAAMDSVTRTINHYKSRSSRICETLKVCPRASQIISLYIQFRFISQPGRSVR